MNMRTHCLSDTLSLLGLNEKAWDGKEGVGEEMLCMDGWPLRSGGDGGLLVPVLAKPPAGVPSTPWILFALAYTHAREAFTVFYLASVCCTFITL